uniref:Uncharacterized protein n=1 Tax=Siphoviridae sp. ctF7F8 TaxID=2826211 RepID=A0A8S5MJH6_9CAUD|nr:MAG TPA: hypothetical protein [Siphoviridae sp. ctF7F8]
MFFLHILYTINRINSTYFYHLKEILQRLGAVEISKIRRFCNGRRVAYTKKLVQTGD